MQISYNELEKTEQHGGRSVRSWDKALDKRQAKHLGQFKHKWTQPEDMESEHMSEEQHAET